MASLDSSLYQDLKYLKLSLGQDMTSLDYSAARQSRVRRRNCLYLMNFEIIKK